MSKNAMKAFNRLLIDRIKIKIREEFRTKPHLQKYEKEQIPVKKQDGYETHERLCFAKQENAWCINVKNRAMSNNCFTDAYLDILIEKELEFIPKD